MQPTIRTIQAPLRSGSTRRLRIAIVEDEPLIALLLEEILEDMGHDICAIEATQDKAVAAIRRERPDLMIVDCRLRVGNGVDAIKEILSERFVPHIFMTGDVIGSLSLAPGTITLRKPFLESELATAIDAALTCMAEG